MKFSPIYQGYYTQASTTTRILEKIPSQLYAVNSRVNQRLRLQTEPDHITVVKNG